MSLNVKYSASLRPIRRGQSYPASSRRSMATILIWCIAPILLFCSQFYLGAFIDLGQIIGQSQSMRAKKTAQNTTRESIEKQTALTKIIDNQFRNKVYLRAGQSIQASYAIPPSANIELVIKQCKSLPVIEVFNCKNIAEQRRTISSGTSGMLQFSVSVAGFYNFSSTASKLRNEMIDPQEYRVFWQRTGFAP